MASSSSSSSVVWPSTRVRQTFYDFFTAVGHKNVAESSLVPPNQDKSILFTNSGMNQFKPELLKSAKDTPSPWSACNSQLCVRAGGKHNDLDDVGSDTYHHSSFEMLGNWSFHGCYGKQQAIGFAWSLLVDVYKLDPRRIYATYFEGDEQVPADREARDLWEKLLPPSHVLPFGAKENLWSMAEEGPCGPCTEIHYDLVGNVGGETRDAASLVNRDDPTVIELWNLVFMQYNRMVEHGYTPLATLHVDTGMGFERLCCILQGKTSNYDTDVFQPLFRIIEECVRVPYDAADVQIARSYRIIADHVRTLIAVLHDDIVPSPNGRGFVVQKLFTRACLYGQQYLKADESFLTRVTERVIQYTIEHDSSSSARSRTLRDRQNLILYVVQGEVQRLGKIMWKAAMVFDKIVKRADRQLTADDALLLKSRGVPEFAIEQFMIDHKLARSL